MKHPATIAPPSNGAPRPRAALDPAIAERFRPFETAPTGMLLADREGTVLATNACLDRIFEYGPGELRDEKVEVLIPSAVRTLHVELRDAFVEYPVPRQMGGTRELHGVAKSGRAVPVEVGLTTIEISGDQYVLAFVLDLTEHKKQEEKFRLVVEAAPNGMIMAGPLGRIKLANQEACVMFGFSRDELVGQTVEVLLPERFRHKHQVYRTSFFQAPESRAMGRGRELFAQRKDGSEFPIEIGLTPIDSTDGRFVMATLIDITARKAAEEQERAKNAQLSRLNEELSNLAYSVSHDLKAPLTAIQGLARIAMEDLETNDIDEARGNLDRICSQAEQLQQLVQDVLALARAGDKNQPWEAVNLSALIAEVVELNRYAPEAKRVEFRVDMPSELPAMSQPARLRQTVENLISNAVKYADSGKEPSFVEVVLREIDGNAELTVRDNGPGIPETCHGQVFQMFRRFDPCRGDGSGLGLAIVKKCVDRLGGQINFQSSPEGTEFRVKLPLEARA